MFAGFFHRSLIIAGLFSVFCGICVAQGQTGGPLRIDRGAEPIVKSVNLFAFDIFKEVTASDDRANILISPYSISVALGMTFNGAGGATRDSIAATLRYDDQPAKQINRSYKNLDQRIKSINSMISIETANSIWHADNFKVKREFLDIGREYFGADILPADFSDPKVCSQINDWIAGKTGGRIRDMLECPIEPDVIMYIINAIYFKGVWKYQFDSTRTMEMPFNLADGSHSACDMMRQRNKYLYQANDDFQAIEIPYGDGGFSMVVFLPADGKSVDKFIADLTYENWNKWQNDFTGDSVTLWLPKFRVNYGTELKDVLTDLGMGIAFSGMADFTGIFSHGGVRISRVLHNTFVQVDEKGTEASAATVVEFKKGPGVKNKMVVNRPFVYIIHDNNTGAILFIGKIGKPMWGKG